ncbi:hypothetical protein GCM10022203_13430 [Micrococcus yunnanensis]
MLCIAQGEEQPREDQRQRHVEPDPQAGLLHGGLVGAARDVQQVEQEDDAEDHKGRDLEDGTEHVHGGVPFVGAAPV